MPKLDMQKLGPVIIANHGGFSEATDNELLRLYRSLPPERQAKYLNLAGLGPSSPPPKKSKTKAGGKGQPGNSSADGQ